MLSFTSSRQDSSVAFSAPDTVSPNLRMINEPISEHRRFKHLRRSATGAAAVAVLAVVESWSVREQMKKEPLVYIQVW